MEHAVKIINARDHPRRCGENSIATNPPPVSLGSPPQVRGKRTVTSALIAITGITPAGAGKTFTFQTVKLRL